MTPKVQIAKVLGSGSITGSNVLMSVRLQCGHGALVTGEEAERGWVYCYNCKDASLSTREPDKSGQQAEDA